MDETCDYCGNTAAYLFKAKGNKVETAACGIHLRRAWDFYLNPGDSDVFEVKRLMKS